MNKYDPIYLPSTSAAENSMSKLSADMCKVIVSFLEGVEATGIKMSLPYWNVLAKKGIFAASKVTGENLKALWELEIHRVLDRQNKIAGGKNTRQLTATESIVFDFVVKDSGYSTLCEDEGENLNESDEFNAQNNVDEYYPQDNTEYLEEYEEEEDAVELSAQKKKEKAPQASSFFRAPSIKLATIEASPKPPVAPTITRRTASIATEKAPARGCKRSNLDDQSREPSLKKPKLTGLQMQKHGVEAILEGNDIFFSLHDRFIDFMKIQNERAEAQTAHMIAQTAAIDHLNSTLESSFENLTNNVRLLGDRVTATMLNIENLRHLRRQGQDEAVPEPDAQQRDVYDDGYDFGSPRSFRGTG